MKTLLIPTDFKLSSTNCITQLIHRYHPQQVNIIMVHMLGVTDSMGELLMLSRRSAEYRLISDAFYNTCHHLRKKHTDSLNDIRIEFFYGNTMAAFKTYLDENNVEGIVKLKGYDYDLLTEKSIDPETFINRCGKQVLVVDTQLPHFEVKRQPVLEVESV